MYVCVMPDRPTVKNEKDLLIRIAGGDQEAFALLLDLYRNKVFSHALTYVKTYQEAEEITQDILSNTVLFKFSLILNYQVCNFVKIF